MSDEKFKIPIDAAGKAIPTIGEPVIVDMAIVDVRSIEAAFFQAQQKLAMILEKDPRWKNVEKVSLVHIQTRQDIDVSTKQMNMIFMFRAVGILK